MPGYECREYSDVSQLKTIEHENDPERLSANREKRAAKAASLMEGADGAVFNAQSKIWDMIHREMVSHRVFSDTEDYNEIRETRYTDSGPKLQLLKAEGCNGLAIFEGKKLLSFEIFGNPYPMKEGVSGNSAGQAIPPTRDSD